MMLIMCPYCGYHLSKPLTNGICSCVNCKRVFDSSRFNSLLSASWVVKRKNITNPIDLANRCKISEDDANLVINLVNDQCYDFQEFLKILESMVEQ